MTLNAKFSRSLGKGSPEQKSLMEEAKLDFYDLSFQMRLEHRAAHTYVYWFKSRNLMDTVPLSAECLQFLDRFYQLFSNYLKTVSQMFNFIPENELMSFIPMFFKDFFILRIGVTEPYLRKKQLEAAQQWILLLYHLDPHKSRLAQLQLDLLIDPLLFDYNDVEHWIKNFCEQGFYQLANQQVSLFEQNKIINPDQKRILQVHIVEKMKSRKELSSQKE